MHDKNTEIRKVCDQTLDIIMVMFDIIVYRSAKHFSSCITTLRAESPIFLEK